MSAPVPVDLIRKYGPLVDRALVEGMIFEPFAKHPVCVFVRPESEVGLEDFVSPPRLSFPLPDRLATVHLCDGPESWGMDLVIVGKWDWPSTRMAA